MIVHIVTQLIRLLLHRHHVTNVSGREPAPGTDFLGLCGEIKVKFGVDIDFLAEALQSRVIVLNL